MELVAAKPSLPLDGIVTFEADGRTWTLLYSVNAWVRLEQAVADDAELKRLIGALPGEKASLPTYRAAFWAGLRDHHPHLTQDDAGNLMQHVGPATAGVLLRLAMEAASPEPDDGARPRKAGLLKRTARRLLRALA